MPAAPIVGSEYRDDNAQLLVDAVRMLTKYQGTVQTRKMNLKQGVIGSSPHILILPILLGLVHPFAGCRRNHIVALRTFHLGIRDVGLPTGGEVPNRQSRPL